MKKLNLLLIILVFLAMQDTLAQGSWISLNGQKEQYPHVEVEKQDMTGMTLTISVPGLYSNDVLHNGVTYQELRFEAWQTLHQVGFPELPVISELIALPDNKLLKVEVLETESVILENILVYPSQTPSKDIADSQYAGFDINEDFYASNTPFPELMANTNKPGIWRDVKISGLHICPFQYKASSRQLEVITHMKLRIDFYGTDTEMVLNRSKNIPKYFYDMYDASLLNFASMGYSLENKKGDDDIMYGI